jgi:hypothetical protein
MSWIAKLAWEEELLSAYSASYHSGAALLAAFLGVFVSSVFGSRVPQSALSVNN